MGFNLLKYIKFISLEGPILLDILPVPKSTIATHVIIWVILRTNATVVMYIYPSCHNHFGNKCSVHTCIIQLYPFLVFNRFSMYNTMYIIFGQPVVHCLVFLYV